MFSMESNYLFKLLHRVKMKCIAFANDDDDGTHAESSFLLYSFIMSFVIKLFACQGNDEKLVIISLIKSEREKVFADIH